MTTAPATHFGFSKLLVRDLEASAAFYTTVCGLRELARVESEIAGRPIREIMYHPTKAGGATFVLLQFLDEQTAGSAVILGFETSDLPAFVDRAVRAGGAIADPMKTLPEHGVKVAFVSDVEGHLIEVVELLAAPAH